MIRRHVLTAACAVALLAVQAAAATAAPAPPGRLGIQLLDAPVSGRNDPRAHLYIVDQLRAGTTITRHMRITNLSGQDAHVSVYAAAASIGGGNFRFADGRAGNDLTSWTSVTPSTASLPGGAPTEATVRIAVPKDATTGERYAVVWAELSTPAGGVREAVRVGIRIYLDVAGTAQASAFTITGIAAARDQRGHPQIAAQVRNTARRALDVAGTVALSRGPGGLQTGPVRTATTVTIAPGDAQNVPVVFDSRLPDGPWLVTVDLSSGTVRRQASATVSFPVASDAPTVVPVSHARHSTWYWWLSGPVLALLALGVATWLVLRRRSRVSR